MDWVGVPGGLTQVGLDEATRTELLQDFNMNLRKEANLRTAHVGDFQIGRHPVTHGEYLLFVEADGYRDGRWWTDAKDELHEFGGPTGFVDTTGQCGPASWANGAPREGLDHPVHGVSWFEAMAYAKWAKARLPSEVEWTRAARGPTHRRYPWGNVFEGHEACVLAEAPGPVGRHPEGASLFGVQDMAGLVAEWLLEPVGPDNERWLVSDGFMGNPLSIRVSARHAWPPERRRLGFGFRLARAELTRPHRPLRG